MIKSNESKERLKEVMKCLENTRIYQDVECNPNFKEILKSTLDWASNYTIFNSVSPNEVEKRSHLTGGAYIAAIYSPKETDLSYILPGAYHASCYMMYDDLIDNAEDLKTAKYLTSTMIKCIDREFINDSVRPFADSWTMLPFTEEQLRIYGHHLKVLYENCYNLCKFQFEDLKPTIEEYLLVRRYDAGMDAYVVFYFFINKIHFNMDKFEGESGVQFRYHVWKHGAILMDLAIYFCKERNPDGLQEPRFKFNLLNMIQRAYQVELASALKIGFAMLTYEEDCILKMVEENRDEELKIIYDGILHCHAHILNFLQKFQEFRYK